MTQRLYHDDAYLRKFEAEVLAHIQVDAKPAVVLDRTLFYPEAGGQLGDHGQLGACKVIDTQATNAGEIAHLLDAAAPAVGSRVTGEIAWPRRRQHMAQHTAQHLLSGALLERTQADTASARLGESALTIDLKRDRIPEAALAAAEDLANDLIDDDLPVRAWFPEPKEFAELTLRRTPKVEANIRVVAIGDFDLSPCGGTHCARTSQLGAIRITGVERYKGMTRVTFTAARRGRVELFAREQIVRGLAAQLSCAPADVSAALDKLRRDLQAGAEELGRVRAQLAQRLAEQLPGEAAVIAELEGDVELLRNVALKLVAAGRDAVLCARLDSGSAVVIMRAAGSALECGQLWKQLAATFGGRGGGRAERAEGKLASVVNDWPAAIAAALQLGTG
jgi:alanyl-tRNA synthetase